MSAVVARARSLLGVPWVHQGRNPAVGIDCIGLVAIAYQVIHQADYPRDPYSRRLELGLIKYFGEPVDGDMTPGDVLAFGFGLNTRHVGICADYVHGGLSVIHTDSVVGRVVEVRLDDRWLRRLRGVYRT